MYEEKSIAALIFKLNKVFSSMLFKEFQHIGFTAPQFFVLRQIFEEPKTIGQISKLVDLSYSTVSGIIDRLERNGMVERIRDEEDRRVVWIKMNCKLTELKNLPQIRIFQESLYNDLLQELGSEEVETIEKSLQKIISHLEKKAGEKS